MFIKINILNTDRCHREKIAKDIGGQKEFWDNKFIDFCFELATTS